MIIAWLYSLSLAHIILTSHHSLCTFASLTFASLTTLTIPLVLLFAHTLYTLAVFIH